MKSYESQRNSVLLVEVSDSTTDTYTFTQQYAYRLCFSTWIQLRLMTTKAASVLNHVFSHSKSRADRQWCRMPVYRRHIISASVSSYDTLWTSASCHTTDKCTSHTSTYDNCSHSHQRNIQVLTPLLQTILQLLKHSKLPSTLWHCWSGKSKSIRSVKKVTDKSETTHKWSAYACSPADAIATTSFLASLKT